jgi:hypothetical protein
VLSQIKQFVTCGSDSQSAAQTPVSPLLKPLSPAPADPEVRMLEKKVEEASQRVAALRESMRARLQDQLTEKLARCRPTVDVPEAEVPWEDEEEEEQRKLSPDPKELRKRLAGAAEQMPALR